MPVGIGDWTAARELNGIYADARELGLEPNTAELATCGFTTIPAALGPELVERLIAAMGDSVTETTGTAPDMATGAGHVDINFQPFLLSRDGAFEDALMNDRVLTRIRYLLGNRGAGDRARLPRPRPPACSGSVSPHTSSTTYAVTGSANLTTGSANYSRWRPLGGRHGGKLADPATTPARRGGGRRRGRRP